MNLVGRDGRVQSHPVHMQPEVPVKPVRSGPDPEPWTCLGRSYLRAPVNLWEANSYGIWSPRTWLGYDNEPKPRQSRTLSAPEAVKLRLYLRSQMFALGWPSYIQLMATVHRMYHRN